MKLGSGAFEGPFSFRTRFEDEKGTNPEELIGAARAGCFSMAFAAELGKAGFTPDHIQTTAQVHLERAGEGFAIGRVQLATEARVPEIQDQKFHEIAERAKTNCPVSKLLAGAKIELQAKLSRI
jgi:osmotically inducible protein OsmC